LNNSCRINNQTPPHQYQPTRHGLEGKIGEKLPHLKKLDEEAGKG